METRKYWLFKRGDDFDLTPHFSSREFQCKCGLCIEQQVSVWLVERLQEIRDALNAPIVVTSGYRCPSHNLDVGGARKSQHLTGNAADIRSQNLDRLYLLCEDHFRSIGDARARKRFIHVDTRPDVRRWAY